MLSIVGAIIVAYFGLGVLITLIAYQLGVTADLFKQMQQKVPNADLTILSKSVIVGCIFFWPQLVISSITPDEDK